MIQQELFDTTPHSYAGKYVYVRQTKTAFTCNKYWISAICLHLIKNSLWQLEVGDLPTTTKRDELLLSGYVIIEPNKPKEFIPTPFHKTPPVINYTTAI